MNNPLAQVSVTSSGGVTLARLRGEIDASNADDIAQEILAQAAPADVVVIDLTAVDYFDSAGMAMLDTVHRTTELRLALPAATIVAEAIATTGLDQIIPCFATVDDALSAGASPAAHFATRTADVSRGDR